MPDPVRRPYEVLILEGPGHGADGKPIYQHLGVVNASGADAAIAAIVESNPYEGRYVAVPQTNWNQRQVSVRSVPQVEIEPVTDEAPDELPPVEAEEVGAGA